MGILVQFAPGGALATTGFQSTYIRLDRMKINTATGGTICAQPNTTATENKVLVTFPSTYAVNTTAANWVVNSTNLPAGSTFWLGMTSGTTTASSATSPANVVTFPSGDLTVGVLYCFNFTGTSTLTTAVAAASNQQAAIQTQTSGSATIDSSQIALTSIADDQIVISAVVPPSFSFVISGNTDAFTANLDPAGIVSTTGKTVTIVTNAKGGWITWVKDSHQGLFSATTSYTIPTTGTINGAPDTLTNGVEGYVLDTDLTTDAAGGCAVTIDPEYNGTSTSAGGTLSANFQPVAACTPVITGTANSDVITLIERAAISGATPAGNDYTDTLTVVGAGNF